MTDSHIPPGAPPPAAASTHAYTRAAVDEYLHAIWLRRQALEAEITTARQRTARANRALARLESLEREVGASLVAAYAQHVATLRLRNGMVPALEPAEAVLDLSNIDDDADDELDEFEEFDDDLDEYENDYNRGADEPAVDFTDLALGAPDGFGDEFFGPSPVQSGARNGAGFATNGYASGAHRA